jgi:uncharacterized protein (TIRG00374 family)
VSRSLRIILSVGLSALFLGFAVRNVEWGKAAAALAGAHYFYALPMAAVTIWTLYIRAQRWRILLRPVGTPAMRTLVDATNIGFMANTLLPLRVGEVIRPVLVSRKEREPLGGILATIILERIFDVFTILFLLGVATALVPVSENVRQWGYRLCGVAVLLGGGVVFVRWQEGLALRLLRLALRPLPRKVADPIDHFFGSFAKALEILESPLTFLQLLAWSLYLWLVISGIYLIGLLQFGMAVPLLVGAIAVTAITAIAVSAPSAPGGIGLFNFGCVLALAIFGISESHAIAYSLVLQVTQAVACIAAGLYSLAREGMTMRQMEQLSESDDAAA